MMFDIGEMTKILNEKEPKWAEPFADMSDEDFKVIVMTHFVYVDVMLQRIDSKLEEKDG